MKSMNIMKCKKYMYVTGRVLMGLFFVLAGIMKLKEPSETAGFMAGAGLPMAGILVWLVIIFLIVAGGMMVAGRKLCLTGILLSVYVLLASLLFHIGDTSGFLKNLALIGGLLALASSCMDKKCCGEMCGPKEEEKEEMESSVDHEHHPEHDQNGHSH